MLGREIAGSGNPGIMSLACCLPCGSSSMTPKSKALDRHADPHAGFTPISSRSTHMLHFSTWPLTGSSCGALYGQTQVQYPQPKQISGSCNTAPYSRYLVYASVGHPFRHTGFSQWLQAIEMFNRNTSGYDPPSKYPTLRNERCTGRLFFSEQADSHAWQAMQLSAVK